MVEDAVASEESRLIGNGSTTQERNHETSSSKKQEVQNSFSSRQKIIFLLIVYGHTAIFMCVSTPFAFLAEYIVLRGGTKEDATLVINFTLLAMAISSGFFGKYQGKIGTKKLYLGGLLCYVVGQVAFGFLQYATNVLTIILAGTIIRIIQGFGQGAYLVAALTIICQEFPHNTATAFGISETFASVGYTCGPLLGSLLFSAFNVILAPFLISNVLLIPLFPLGIYLIKTYEQTTNAKDVMDRGFIKKPSVVFLIMVITSVYGSFSSIGTVLGSLYLLERGLTLLQVGIVLVILSLTYSVFSIIAGFIIPKGVIARRVIWSIGFLGLCGMPFVFTPTLPQYGTYIGYAVLGVFYALILISSFAELLELAVSDRPGSKADFAIHSAVSGAWNLALGIGEFSYPIVGAAYVQYTRFEFVVSANFMLGVCLAVIAAAFAGVWQYCRKCPTINAGK